MGILDEYRMQLQEDRKNENYEPVEKTELTEEQRSEFKKQLDELRNNPNDMENVYRKKMSEMVKKTEDEMFTSNMINTEDINNIQVYHAYCDCGEELISKTPAMLNPFTFEKICKHKCEKCGKEYNLEYAYPRLVVKDNKGNEIPVYTR